MKTYIYIFGAYCRFIAYRLIAVWLLLIAGLLIFVGVGCNRESPETLNSFYETQDTLSSESHDERVQLEQLMYFDPDSAVKLSHNRLTELDTANYKQRIFYYNIIAGSYIYQARYKNALEYVHRHLELAFRTNNQRNIAEAYHNLSFIYSQSRRYKDAVEFMRKAITIYEHIADSTNLYVSHNNLGRLYYDIDDLDKARHHFSKAYHWFHNTGDELFLPAVSNHKAMYYARMHQPDSALYYFSQGIDISKKTNNNYGLSIIYFKQGDFYLDMGDTEAALFNYEKSDSIAELFGFVSKDCFPRLGISRSLLKQGNLHLALQSAYDAYEQATALENNDLIYLSREVLADIYQEKGDFEQAYVNYRLASDLKTQLYEETGIYQVYNIEVEQLSEQMAMKNIEMEKQRLLLSKRHNNLIMTVIVAVSLIIIISLSYYFYLTKARAIEKEKRHQIEIKYSKEKNWAVMEAEAHERKLLAAELHDSIGSQLSLAKLTLANVVEKENLPFEKKNNLLNATVKSIDDVIKEVKGISNSMIPLALSEKGLKEAIIELVAKYSKIRESKISLSIVGLNNMLPSYKEQALFQTLQELLINAIRHAGCNEITIQIQQFPDELSIMIEDDGCGFDPDSPDKQKGLGLKNAHSRIENLNGQFLIDSLPGRGTIVNIVIPIDYD